jgi:hypothetical protein
MSPRKQISGPPHPCLAGTLPGTQRLRVTHRKHADPCQPRLEQACAAQGFTGDAPSRPKVDRAGGRRRMGKSLVAGSGTWSFPNYGFLRTAFQRGQRRVLRAQVVVGLPRRVRQLLPALLRRARVDRAPCFFTYAPLLSPFLSPPLLCLPSFDLRLVWDECGTERSLG